MSGRNSRAHWASAAAVAQDVSNQIAALPALPSSHYVMQPVSAEVRATLRGESALLHGAPRTSTELRLSALGMRLSEHQLRDSVRLLEYVTSDVIGAPDSEDDSWAAADDAPTAPPRPVGCAGGEARAWWRFALRRVREEVRRQKGWRLGTGFFEQRRRARLRYVELYRRAQGKPWLSELGESEAAELTSMERSMLVEDTVQFRSLAHVALQAEEEAYLEQQAPHLQKRRSSWVGWLMGSQEEAEVPSHVLDFGSEINLDAAQRATLAALMAGGAAERNATADASPQGAAASEYVEHELKLTLDLLSFTLTASKPAAAAAAAATVAASAGSAAPAAAAPEVFDAETAALLRAAGAETEAAAPVPAVGAAAAATTHDFARLSLLGFEVVLAKRPAGLRSEGSLHSVEMYDLNAVPGALGHALVRPAPATGQETGTAAAAAGGGGRRGRRSGASVMSRTRRTAPRRGSSRCSSPRRSSSCTTPRCSAASTPSSRWRASRSAQPSQRS